MDNDFSFLGDKSEPSLKYVDASSKEVPLNDADNFYIYFSYYYFESEVWATITRKYMLNVVLTLSITTELDKNGVTYRYIIDSSDGSVTYLDHYKIKIPPICSYVESDFHFAVMACRDTSTSKLNLYSYSGDLRIQYSKIVTSLSYYQSKIFSYIQDSISLYGIYDEYSEVLNFYHLMDKTISSIKPALFLENDEFESTQSFQGPLALSYDSEKNDYDLVGKINTQLMRATLCSPHYYLPGTQCKKCSESNYDSFGLQSASCTIDCEYFEGNHNYIGYCNKESISNCELTDYGSYLPSHGYYYIFSQGEIFCDFLCFTNYYMDGTICIAGSSAEEEDADIDSGLVVGIICGIGMAIFVFSIVIYLICSKCKGSSAYRINTTTNDSICPLEADSMIDDSIPQVTFDQGNNPYMHTACTICFQDFEENEVVRKIKCGHIFHPTCIETWIKNCSGELQLHSVKEKKCPICNQLIFQKS